MKSAQLQKTSISVRLPLSLHERIHDIAHEMSIDADSQLYRWIIEGFIQQVDYPEDGVPPLPVTIEMARKILHRETSPRLKNSA